MLKNLTIAVIDDDLVDLEDIDRKIKTIAAKHPAIAFTVLLYNSSEQAMRDIKVKNDIALLILDIHMPEMDGIEFINHMAKENIHIPVLLTTGINPEIMHVADKIGRMSGVSVIEEAVKPISESALTKTLLKLELIY
ncbi:response regulator [Dasania sp. GY-MA-18]|uniref:Response regulator n=1 Tax=Dasania phycosphaerae TaxID=2950436 RepID=A0A9J6RI22_9GAMM|nr:MULTISPECIES: response regulator [Dasania]MCR8921484.1 response regulator [Dasania sp. GY-MA-18]MCZ0863912.1 response regulator [Dasania phycosphaerae]MCZ0867640.1 response regulator [Dasania phycosphaerae]